MSDSIDLKPIQDQLKSKGPIFILFGNNASVDHVASALGLYLVLKQNGQDVTVASPVELRTEFSRLVGLNDVGKTIGNRNLVISFSEYDPGSIEKISHNDGANNRFELVIQPKSGHKAPNPKNVDFSYRGAQADLIFLIGVSRLEDLDNLYEQERNLFNQATTVSFNRRQSPSYAAISIVDNQASSISEMMAEFIHQLEIKLEGDAASNLLAGIDYATNRFQNPVISAQAFTTAGQLLEAGAKRQPPRITSAAQMQNAGAFTTSPFSPAHPFASGQFPPTAKPQTQSPKPQAKSQPTQKPQSNSGQAPFLPTITPPNANKKASKPSDSKNPPKDWLEPKIFKGGSKV